MALLRTWFPPPSLERETREIDPDQWSLIGRVGRFRVQATALAENPFVWVEGTIVGCTNLDITIQDRMAVITIPHSTVYDWKIEPEGPLV